MTQTQTQNQTRTRVDPRDKEVKGWFLTYPQCNVTPEDLLLLLKAIPNTPAIVEYVIAAEKHADGTPHLHAFLRYAAKIGWTARRWDLPDLQHGHYVPAKSWWAVQQYIKKGGAYISSIQIDAATSKKAARNRDLLELPVSELVEKGVISAFQIKSLLENKRLWTGLQISPLPRCVGFIPNAFGLLLPLQVGKQRHHWFWSALPNTGKTTFLKSLTKTHPCYFYNQNEKFQTVCSSTQFVLLDEYSTAKLLLTDLNQICDGTFQYCRKGESAVTLEEPIVIICGNRRPEEVYTSEHNWPLINARFIVHCLDE